MTDDLAEIDAQLVDLLAERLEATAATDDPTDQEVIDRAAQLAEQRGVDVNLTRAAFRVFQQLTNAHEADSELDYPPR